MLHTVKGGINIGSCMGVETGQNKWAKPNGQNDGRKQRPIIILHKIRSCFEL